MIILENWDQVDTSSDENPNSTLESQHIYFTQHKLRRGAFSRLGSGSL